MVRKVKGDKMAKERLTKFLKHLFLLFLGGLLLFPSLIKGAVNSDNVIGSNATGYLGRSYEWGDPPNKETEYGGGGIMDYGFPEGMDCSGLVSLCAGLRRHYFVKDIDLYTDSITWENLQPGDLLLGSSYVLIFEKWVEKEGTDTNRWKAGVIHASYVKQRVRRDTFTVRSCINEGWSPCRFKNDTTPPKIRFLGVENEKYYNSAVTLTIKGNDDIEGPTYAYGLYENKRFVTKTFTERGKYEIPWKAIDWKKNEKPDKIFPVRFFLPYLWTGAEENKGEVTISYLEGDVDVFLKGMKDWEKARLNQKLKEGDRIRTRLQSKAEIKLSDGSTINISENSIMDIKELFEKGLTRKSSFMVWMGGIKARVERLKTKDSEVKFYTPTAALGLRGTTVWLLVDWEGKTRAVFEKGSGYIYSDKEGEKPLNENEEASVSLEGDITIKKLEMKIVPDVVGKSLTNAKVDITRAGLKIGEIRAEESTEPPDTVLSQYPQGGSKVLANTSVSLVVASFIPSIIVPDLIGLSKVEAIAKINEAGLVLGMVVEHISERPKGEVLRQRPISGNKVKKGSPVDIAISKGPNIIFYIYPSPILEEVAMWASESGLTYQARWEKTKKGVRLNVLYRRKQPIGTETITVTCIFSEPMNTTQNPLVRLYCEGRDTLIANKNAYWANETTFVGFTEKISKNDNRYKCIVNLGVFKAQDKAGNPLDVRPDVPALQEGEDANHKKVLFITSTNIKADHKKGLFYTIIVILILMLILIPFYTYIYIYIRFILGLGR
jgi:hypothetical protein